MRFIVMHKVDAKMESGAPPSQQIIQNMGKLVGEGLKSGMFLDGAGLHRSAQRVRLRFLGGEVSVTRGPFTSENELVTGLLMVEVRSMEEAVEHARRFARAGDLEIEIGPVVEPWDLRLAPKPPHLETSKFLFLVKAGERPSAELRAGIDRVTEELSRAGVLLKQARLGPSGPGARLPRAGGAPGKRTWVDGPFTESKELVAGFSIIEVPSKEEAIGWATRYAEILEDNEVDVRPVEELSAGGR